MYSLDSTLDDEDERFHVGHFRNLKDLEDFKERFRPISVQLQDNECSKLIEGMTVCASYVFSHTNEIKFYDAVVESMSREKLLVASHNPHFISKDGVSIGEVVSSHKRIHDSTVEYKSRSLHSKSQACHSEETKSPKRSINTTWMHKGRSNNHWERAGQDVDLGGKSAPTENHREIGDFHYILIDNLEKDLTASTIVDFIYKHTSISCQAHVFPSLSLESYTRGIVVVDNQEKLQKLFDFINNSFHIILSLRGRPWVITEKKLRSGTVAGALGNFMPNFKSQPCDRIPEPGEKIRIVSFGTEEHKKAKQLRALFMEFSEHVQRLHKSLALEEKKIMQPANTT